MTITSWVIWVESKRDFLIWDIEIPKLEKQNNIWYEYNQWVKKETKQSCTLFASFGAISDLMDHEFTEQEIDEMNEISFSLDRKRWQWRWLYKAVDLCRDYWNKKHPDNKIISFRVDTSSEKFHEAKNLWYTMPTTYWGNGYYNKDFKDDWVVQWKKFIETYWHAVGAKDSKKYQIKIKDSYKGREYNHYDIEHYDELIKNTNYSKRAYIFVKEKQLSKSKDIIKLESWIKVSSKVDRKVLSLINKLSDNLELQETNAQLAKDKMAEYHNALKNII